MKKALIRIPFILLKVVIFALILLLLLQATSVVLMPKWITNKDSYQTNVMKGYYELPDNTLDALYIGSSDVYRGISPMEIWNQQGIAGYDFAFTGARMWTNYYILKEALRSQSPTTVFMEMEATFSNGLSKEVNTRKTYDYMEMSPVKWEAINDPILNNSNFDILSYFFPVLRYHDRISQLNSDDFTAPFADYHNPQKGFAITSKANPPKQDKIDSYMKKTDDKKQLEQKVLKYFEKIVNLCKENNIKLVLFNVPSIENWNYARHNGTAQLAKDYGLDYLDMNMNAKEIGIDWTKDTCDQGTHLNLSGAQKTSKYFGDYIAKNYSLPDHRADDNYATWNDDYEEYVLNIEQTKLDEEKDAQEAKEKAAAKKRSEEKAKSQQTNANSQTAVDAG